MHIQIQQNKRKGWRFDVVAGNGIIILSSRKPYANERNVREAVKLIQAKIGSCPVREVV